MNTKACWFPAVWYCCGFIVGSSLAAEAPKLLPASPPKPPATVVAAQSAGAIGEWKIFRAVHPYHIQGVALAAPRKDGSRVLVIAEPPPDITFNAIKSVDPAAMARTEVRSQPMGHDGWVRDLATVLPKMSEGEVSGLCARLNALLFGTSYKASVFDIPASAPRSPEIRLGEKGLDLHVSVSDLQRWLLEDEMGLVPVLGGPTTKLKDLLNTGARGVFFSAQEGLVVWLLPKGVDVSSQRFAARQFALDSDIVLGAISGEKGTAIVARERSTPVAVLPPLRVETIFQLAAARTAELAQSYERTNAFSGRFDETHDWAPIYLSQQLIDTEYGSLLNITDQLLKSWSNAGETKYEKFLYPDPSRYPFPKPIALHLKVNQITYNWNTKGAGYAVESGPFAVLALNRTGALPVSYIPGDGAGERDMMGAEDTAYEYFAGLGDPNLTRVVQYAALYQAFINLDVGKGGALDAPPTARVHPILLDEMLRTYQRLNDADETQLAALAKPVIDAGMKEVQPEIDKAVKEFEKERKAKFTAELRALANNLIVADTRKAVAADCVEKLTAARDVLRARVNGAADPRSALGEFVLHQEGDAEKEAAHYLRQITDLVALREKLVAGGASLAKGWIHTPVVVVSWNQGTTGGVFVGGHNLDAGVSIFHMDPAQPKGAIKLMRTKGGDKVAFNPADRDRVTEIVRDVGRRERDLSKLWPDVERKFAASVARPIRPIRTALGFAPHPPGVRGLRPSDAPSPAGIARGWESHTAPLADSAEIATLQKAAGQPVVTVRATGSHYEMISGEGGERPLATGETLESMVDALRHIAKGPAADGKTELVVYMEKLTPLDQRNLARSLDARAAGDRMTRLGKQTRISPKELTELTHGQYDMAKIKLSKIERRTVAGGEEISVGFELPAKAPAAPSIFGKFVIFVKGLVPGPMLAKIEGSIRTAMSLLRGDTGVLELNGIIRQLKKDMPEIEGVQFEIRGEAGDVTFVQASPRAAPAFHVTRYRLAA